MMPSITELSLILRNGGCIDGSEIFANIIVKKIYNHSGVIAGEDKTLICYVNYFELQKVKEIISRNKGSFSTVSTIDEILR